MSTESSEDPESGEGRRTIVVSNEARALFPYWDRPWMAGMYGAFVAHLTTAVFALFADIDHRTVEGPRLKTAAVGFVTGFIIRAYLNWWHRRAALQAAREQQARRGR